MKLEPEPLGKDFEKVLNDNRWELYEVDRTESRLGEANTVAPRDKDESKAAPSS